MSKNITVKQCITDYASENRTDHAFFYTNQKPISAILFIQALLGFYIMVIENWFLPSVIALTIWGVTGFLSKMALKTLPPLHLVVYGALFFLTTAVFVQVFYGGPEFHPLGVTLAIGVGAAGSFGQLLFLLALRDGPLTYVAMISSLYPLIATVLAFIILGEPVSLRQTAGIGLGLCAIVLLVVSRDKQPS